MIHYSTLEEIKAYRDNSALSQTEIKNLLSGNKKKFKESVASLCGSYLDAMICLPDYIDDIYIVSDIKRPSDTICTLVDGFVNHLLFDSPDIELYPDLSLYDRSLPFYIEGTEYYDNLKTRNRVDLFIKNGGDWWKTKVELGEKEIITSFEKELVEKAYTLVYTNKEINWVFSDINRDIYYQYPVYWNEEKVDCKGLVDILHKKDNWRREIDIKYTTCPDFESWFKVAMSLGYPIQKAFYKSGLEYEGGIVSESYWLVCSPYWCRLVPVIDLILNHGKWGGNYQKGLYEGFMGSHEVGKYFPGYLKGIEIYKGLLNPIADSVKVSEEKVEELFLKNIY